MDFAQSNAIGRCAFFCIKVLIDSKKPFSIGFENKKNDGDFEWYQIKYERLSDTCFHHGSIGHVIKFYKEREGDNIFSIDQDRLKFGPLMRCFPSILF